MKLKTAKPGIICAGCAGPRSALGGRFCRACYLARTLKNRKIRIDARSEKRFVLGSPMRLYAIRHRPRPSLTPPPWKPGYCKECRVVRLSQANTNGICDECSSSE